VALICTTKLASSAFLGACSASVAIALMRASVWSFGCGQTREFAICKAIRHATSGDVPVALSSSPQSLSHIRSRVWFASTSMHLPCDLLPADSVVACTTPGPCTRRTIRYCTDFHNEPGRRESGGPASRRRQRVRFVCDWARMRSAKGLNRAVRQGMFVIDAFSILP